MISGKPRERLYFSVDLQGEYDRVSSEKLVKFLNSKVSLPEWIPYLSHVMLNRHLKVVSQNNQGSPWLHIYEDLP
jgi:hypothetical protein